MAPSSSATLPGRKQEVKTLHKKSHSVGSIDREDIANANNEEDDFSDTDDEEQWQKESMIGPQLKEQWQKDSTPGPQTTYV